MRADAAIVLPPSVPFSQVTRQSSPPTQLPLLDVATYSDWVHRPVPGHPIFFASPWLEGITKVRWWVVPLIWVPAALAWFFAHRSLPLALAALCALAGALSWQAAEYALHRWVFHARPRGRWTVQAHFLLHGCHHKFPQDVERLVFPPLPAAVIAFGVYCALTGVLPTVGLLRSCLRG